MAHVIFKRENWSATGLMLLIVVLGAYFRFNGLGWDDYTQFHPDERFMTGYIGIQLGRNYASFSDGNEAVQEAYCREAYPDTNGVGGYFDARCSTMNPHNLGAGHFAYGTLPVFTAYWFATSLNTIYGTTDYTAYDAFPLVMRSLSALYDTITILIAFGIGFELRGKWTGVLAAALYTGAVLPIQIAHFGTADAMAAMWVGLTLYLCLRIQRTGSVSDYLWAGMAFGAALASRFNVAPLVLSIMAVSGVRMVTLFAPGLPGRERALIFWREFGGLCLAGFATLLIFRIFNPYAFMGPGFFGLMPNLRWIEDLGQARYETSPANSAPPQWQWVGRVPYLFPFSNMVLWGMGVAFGAAAWVATVWSAVRLLRGRVGSLITLPLLVWIAVYFAFVGGNFVTSMRYFLPMYAAFAGLAAYGLIGVVLWSKRAAAQSVIPYRARRPLAYGLVAVVAGFTLLWAGMFTNIYRNMATFTQAGHWVWENLPGDFAMRIDGAPEGTPLINIAMTNSLGTANVNISNATQIHPSYPQSALFTPGVSGEISAIDAPRIGDYQQDNGSTSLRVWIINPTTGDMLVDTVLTDDFDYDPNRVGRGYTLPIDPPITVEAGTTYQFNAQVVSGGPLVTTGTVMAWEGAWDEPVPPQVCTLPVGVTLADSPRSGLLGPQECRKRNTTFTLVTSMQLDIVNEDEDAKRDNMVRVLDHADYLIIGTNRRYDSQSRIPLRWPLTNRYYEALFSGELGYDLVAEFQETFELGPLRVSDQHLPFYDSPAWLNEFEAEEAFHVYDHPAVFVFKKRADYSSINTQQVLGAVSLVRATSADSGEPNATVFGPVVWDVQTAHTTSPTALTLPAALDDIQREGGTWSERFDRDSAVNTNGVVAVLTWYAVVWLLGIVVWPVLYHALAGLSDRGYAVSRYFAMTLVGFIAWAASSSGAWPLWHAGGLWGITLVLGLISAFIAYRSRAGLVNFVRARWRLLLTIEVLTAGLFVVMLLVRLSNPDVWTIGYGGEKPMDFSMFNGVLRSTVFPPIDPWYSGGYINYYYFGYVVVSVPTLMLAVVPGIAYNLILPTIFAAAGVAAFSAAYTLVDSWRERRADALRPVPKRLGNPMVAGITALLMAVVLGNLDTPRVLLNGLARMGGYSDQITLQRFLEEEATEANGGIPLSTEQFVQVAERAADPSFVDNVRYELFIGFDQWRAVWDGLWLLREDPLAVGAERWFWAPSRVILESVGGGAINEMPFFTFVYGDLHAHMMTMPLILFVSAFVVSEVLLAGREQRRWIWRMVAVVLAGGLVGLLRAANTWDYPTYLTLGVAGLGYAVWMRWRRIDRWSLLDMFVTLAAFVGAGLLAARPYTEWYASIYNSVTLWEGTKTPLWAYWQIHGLFLFFIVSLLVWETVRWLRSVKVRALAGRGWLVFGGVLFGLGVLVLSVLLALIDYQAALIALPLIVWIAALFFRPTQSPAMRLVLVLAGLALTLTFAVEVVVLAGDSARQNTVFKFYIHVWMLFSVAAGAAAAWLLQAAEDWRSRVAIPWYVVGSVLFFSALAFPVTAVLGKANFRLAPEIGATLDGQLFMSVTDDYYEEYPNVIDMRLDYETIRWLQDNVQGTPTIMEGRSHHEGSYQWVGRISVHTGLPSLVGWNYHQSQQRTLPNLGDLVGQRASNVNAFYTTPNITDAWRILMNYEVEYVVVAALERATYGGSGGLDKFDRMVAEGLLEPAYTNADGLTLIYRVLRDQNPGMFVSTASVGD